ncbi:hypothetical protein A8E96_21590 [Burkholderia cenocepacia]|nr:hypothetical protein A8E96_21590 [Burkholderia cenocepacia]
MSLAATAIGRRRYASAWSGRGIGARDRCWAGARCTIASSRCGKSPIGMRLWSRLRCASLRGAA